MILKIFQLLFILLAVATFLSQILFPYMRGTKTWPMFRSRRNKLSKEIMETKEAIDVQFLEEELEALKKKVKKPSTKSKGDNNG